MEMYVGLILSQNIFSYTPVYLSSACEIKKILALGMDVCVLT
jgi:hypothetical protein